jgi:hypothetical protein
MVLGLINSIDRAWARHAGQLAFTWLVQDLSIPSLLHVIVTMHNTCCTAACMTCVHCSLVSATKFRVFTVMNS